jgi:hypothetical protein
MKLITDKGQGEYVDFCSVCGIALKLEECRAAIEGRAVDFVAKGRGSVDMTLCDECWQRIYDNSIAGLEPAILKRLKLESND